MVLRPIIERLADRGHEVSVTAREYGQTVGVLERLGIDHRVFGRHAGAPTGAKAAAVGTRSAALARWARGQQFDLALAHGSVDIAVVSALLRIPLGVVRVLIADMAAEGLVRVHQPQLEAGRPDVNLLERVLSGLRRL